MTLKYNLSIIHCFILIEAPEEGAWLRMCYLTYTLTNDVLAQRKKINVTISMDIFKLFQLS